MTELLPSLESLCAELAARRMSPEERKRLKITSDKALACAQAGDPDGYEEANKEVQQAIRLGSHNRYLIERILDIRKRVHLYWPPGIRYFGTMVMDRLIKEQQEVVDAVLAGDDYRAREAMRSHLIYRASHFIDTIASLTSSEDYLQHDNFHLHDTV
jgi:DNA-binding GntR family transcriptional regulator